MRAIVPDRGGPHDRHLPKGWHAPDSSTALRLERELRREVRAGHPLFNRAIQVIGHTEGRNDDILLLDTTLGPVYWIVHLTWRGSVEGSPDHPAVTFIGSYSELTGYGSSDDVDS